MKAKIILSRTIVSVGVVAFSLAIPFACRASDTNVVRVYLEQDHRTTVIKIPSGNEYIALVEQPTQFTVQMDVASYRDDEKHAVPKVGELNRQAWLLRSDGTSIPQLRKPDLVGTGGGGYMDFHLIFCFPKESTNEVAGIVVNIDGKLYCQELSTYTQSSAKSEQWYSFQILPPITNANPSIRLPFLIHVPTKLKIERTNDMLSVKIDNEGSLEATNLMVGTNMATGVESEFCLFPVGEPRPDVPEYGSGGTDFNLGTRFWHTKQDGIPLPGKEYVAEMNLRIFETDIPPQHHWRPQGSKKYKVLWQRTLKQTIE